MQEGEYFYIFFRQSSTKNCLCEKTVCSEAKQTVCGLKMTCTVALLHVLFIDVNYKSEINSQRLQAACMQSLSY